MAILTTSELGQTFGVNDLFSEITLQLEPRDRVGLVGPNGSGKTTLLLILAGLLEPTTGTVAHSDDLTLGYLRQEAVLTFAGVDHTIYDEMLTVFADLRQLEADMRHMEARMSAGEMGEELLVEYGRCQSTYEHGGGYQYQHDIKRVLLGLGFPQAEWATPLTHLSGGQKTRLLLGRLLLEMPDLLILDEPTNHLDVAAIEWLEGTLRTWDGSLIIVSHDRYFLDKVVNKVWDLQRGRVQTYRGGYTSYTEQRQTAWEREMALFTAEKERLTQELDFIRKHIAGGKSDIAKGKLKRLTRDIILLEQSAETGRTLDSLQNKSWLEIGDRARAFSANEAARRLRDLHPPANKPPTLNLRLQSEERSSRLVLRTGELDIGYANTPLFTTDKILLERLDIAALIGPNGSGKTTFLRTLMGETPPREGWIKFGDNVQIGYFAQGHDQLTLSRRVLDEVLAHQAVGEPIGEQAARNYLAQYLFTGDDVFKRVADLSGGERGRLALALLALDGANFLLLDEPTNHLDIPAQEVLQSVLEQFDGTILLVSHDRYLVDRLATQIWELRDGRLHIFDGSYQEFLMGRQTDTPDLDPLSRLDEIVPEGTPLDLSWVAEMEAEAERPLPTSQRRYEIEEQIVKYEAWEERISREIAHAELLGDAEALAQLQDEYKVVLYQLAQLAEELELED